MLANFSRVDAFADVDELVSFLAHVREAARNFAELGDRFRNATSRNFTPIVLKHDVNTVFAVQAGDLLCQCWRNGMLSVYRPHFYLPDEDEPRIRYPFSWFTFIRWHLATIFKNRFRDDWKSEFAPEMDQLKGQDHHSQRGYQSVATEDAKALVVWRLNLYADVQATACDILSEELGQLAEATEKQLSAEMAKLRPPAGSDEQPEVETVEQAALRLVAESLAQSGVPGLAATLSSATSAERASVEMIRLCESDDNYYAWSADEWRLRLRVTKRSIIGNSKKGISPCRGWKLILEWRAANKEQLLRLEKPKLVP